MIYLAIWGGIIATLGLVMAFARTGPEEARSTLARWAELIGLKRIAATLTKYALNQKFLGYGWWALLLMLFAGGMLFQGWLMRPDRATMPEHTNGAVSSRSERSRQTLNELLDESGKLLDIVERIGLPLYGEWRESITTQNPERICLELDSRFFQEKITALASKLESAHREISAIFDKNRIDQVELNQAFDSRAMGVGAAGFDAAAQALRNYSHEINLLGEHPACEVLIKSNSIPSMLVGMVRGLDQFGIWLARSQDGLNRFRDNLRQELRNTP